MVQQRAMAITGATGFVGRNLCQRLAAAGWRIIPLGRADFGGDHQSLAGKLAGVQGVINLAGAPVIGRWTERYKRILYESRVLLTRKLVAALALTEVKPEVLISTSAVGIYAADGSHAEDSLTMAENFLGKLASEWEAAARTAEAYGVRTVIFRLGVVLGKDGGSLKKMLLPFKLGLGGTLGNGAQPFSWIHLDDLLRGYETVLHDRSYSGIYNLTAPEPSTNQGLTTELGQLLARPTMLPLPAWLLALLFGEGAQVLTSGQRVYPQRLLAAGFSFRYPRLRQALQACLD